MNYLWDGESVDSNETYFDIINIFYLEKMDFRFILKSLLRQTVNVVLVSVFL